MKKQYCVFLYAFFLLIVCISNVAFAVEAERVLRIAQSQTIQTLDGGVEAQRQTVSLLFCIYDPLFFKDRDGSLRSGLALDYEFLDDVTLRLYLRENISFHNGEPFNAETVKFSIERTLDPQLASQQRVFYSPVKQVNVVDNYIVDVVTHTPAPDLVERLSLYPVVPRQVVLDRGSDFLASNPIGTGPYVFDDWVRGSYVSLEANKNYWGNSPAFDTIIWYEIPDNSARVNALLSGDVDLINNVPPERLTSLQSRNDVEVGTIPGVRGVLAYFDTLQSPLADPLVRQAINYAVDVPEIIEFVLEGMGQEIISQTPPLYLGYDESLEGTYQYDPKKATQLLSEAGYPNGFDLLFYTPAGRYLKDREVSEAIAGQLNKVGIKTTVIANESATHVSLLFDQRNIKDDKAAVFLLAYGIPVLESGIGWDEFLGSNSKSGLWVNDEFNELVNTGLQTIDSNKREEFYKAAHKILVDESPVLFLYQQKDVYSWSSDLVWEPRADELIVVSEIDVK